MHVRVRLRPLTHTECGLRFPPQYHNLNSRHPQGPKRRNPDVYTKIKKPSKSPVMEPPLCSPNRVSTETGALTPRLG